MYKSQLLEVVKRKQSRSNRVETEEILEKLVESNKEDKKAFQTSLSGNWRLLWSSQTADANPLQTPASVLGGDCYQVVDEQGGAEGPRVENVVVWPSLGNLTLRGGAALRRESQTECVITINSFTLELGDLSLPLLKLTDTVPVAVRDVAKVKAGSQLVTVTSSDKAERVLNRRQGTLKVLYVDREGLRVSQGDNSLLYVHQRQ